MTVDRNPFSRPTVDSVRDVLSEEKKHSDSNPRTELIVPAGITTNRGNTVAAMVIDVNRFSMRLLHAGSIATDQEVMVNTASDAMLGYSYRLIIKDCRLAFDGLFISEGLFAERAQEQSD
jgi:hypothetical protein